MSLITRAAAGTCAVAIGAAWISGCNGEASEENIGASVAPIQGGDNDDAHQFAVGILEQLSRGVAICSGALLAPNLVATARHCVSAISGNGVVTCPTTQFGAPTPAGDLVVTTDADVRTRATRYAVSQVIVPSGADQISVCGNDIALLILAQNITLPQYVMPAINPPMTDHTAYSTTVTDIGYGESSATDTAGTTAGFRRIKQGVKLACIPNDTGFTDCFPSGASQIAASEFLSGNGTCEGDSGSSAFEQTNFDAGRWLSFGVVSRGGSSGATCNGGIYSRFDSWSALIIDAATQAATRGGYALPAWAGGPDGGTGVGVDAGSGDSSPPDDAGAAPDSMGGAEPVPDAGAPAPTPPGDGCNCAAGRPDAPEGWQHLAQLAGSMLALGALAKRRRRQRRRRPAN